MKIQYLNCDNKYKLFSFYRHDYKEKYIDGVYYMIDGGQEDYIRCSLAGKLESNIVKNLIKDIREQFYWIQNFDKFGNKIISKKILLKDLKGKHICEILSYFTNMLFLDNKKLNKEWCIIHEIFIQELNYRIKEQN